MNFHPAANSFPMMDEQRYAELVEDMRVHGQIEPITVCEGMVLDGRNRFKACSELGIQARTRPFDGDPWAYVWSLNGQRRDLVDEQRYLIWKFCNENSEAFQAEQRRIQEEANQKRSDAAKERERAYGGTFKIPVVRHSVAPLDNPHKGTTAKATAAKVNPGAVARGDKLVSRRPDLAEKVRQGDLKPAEAHRQMKKEEVAEKVQELPRGKYRVLYADPPWQYGNTFSGGDADFTSRWTAAETHYPSMPLSELKALDIPSITADDAVLWLWATCPLLEDALELAKAWGFRYKAQFVWDKVKHNMGHYNSVRHELLLICTKGSCTPENVTLFDSVQSIERTEHSEKPEEFRHIIDTLYPSGPRIELFARKRVEKWEAYGNELP